MSKETKKKPLRKLEDPSVAIRTGTFAEIETDMEPGTIGISIDLNNILWRKDDNGKLYPLTDGIFTSAPEPITAAYTAKVGDFVIIGTSGLPTLPLLTGVAEGTQGEFSSGVQPAVQSGMAVRILNNTASAVNVATNTGASINGAGAGTAYSLAAHTAVNFVLDVSGTNWAVA